MKKILFGILIFCFTLQVNAQDYNKWSLDFGVGVTEAINPFSPGYETGAFGFGQANLGLRYMLNEKFGLRFDVGYNEFVEGNNSLPFRANYYRTSLEGVVNAGNLLKFSSWTKRFNLLFHGGLGVSGLRTLTPIDNGSADPIMNFIVGFTPQFKISNRISLFLDASAIFHDYQHSTFDGATNTTKREVSASIFNTSIGVNVSIGKHKANADFLQDEEVVVNNEIDDIKRRLNNAETEIATLKSKKVEKPIVDKVELVRELDSRYARKGEVSNNRYSDVVTSSNVDFIRKLLNNGYINVYFDTNKSEVQKGSLNSINYLKQFMMDNPNVSAVLIGYADESGKENQNITLSRKRAKTVFDILVSSGINANRLSFSGGGEDKTVSKGARQFARKVTFKIN